MRRLLIVVTIAAALLLDPTIQAQAKVHAPPNAPCDEDHVMDVFIVNGVWFECVCEKLTFTGDLCDWYELGPAPALRKHAKKRRLIPVLIVKRVFA